MEKIRLALQGYNYGPGYISWAVSHYGGYSKDNAAEFSDMKAFPAIRWNLHTVTSSMFSMSCGTILLVDPSLLVA